MKKRILNIYIDEGGNDNLKQSEFYIISFVFHDINDDISYELNKLEQRLKNIDYDGMIHTSLIVRKEDEYKNMDIKMRKYIINAIYYFIQKSLIKINSIIINEKYLDDKYNLIVNIEKEIDNMIKNNCNYFELFDEIIIYYDNGQKFLEKIIEKIFCELKGFKHKVKFDKKMERLFQVADFLTYIDKTYYKLKIREKLNKKEKLIFTEKEIKRIIKNLNKKRL